MKPPHYGVKIQCISDKVIRIINIWGIRQQPKPDSPRPVSGVEKVQIRKKAVIALIGKKSCGNDKLPCFFI